MMFNNNQLMQLNQFERDYWVTKSIEKFTSKGKTLLDVGAGTGPYKELCNHLKYISHDFGEYEGVKLGGGTEYTSIDIKSDIVDIPLEDSSVDYILCTEVIEHVPEPLKAFKEFQRILKEGGVAIITAPFTSGMHQEPYHFYAGFSKYFYHYVANKFNFEIVEIFQHGGLYRIMAQEIVRVVDSYNQLKAMGLIQVDEFEKLINISNVLANKMIDIEKSIGKEKNVFNKFCIGYGVIMVKS